VSEASATAEATSDCSFSAADSASATADSAEADESDDVEALSDELPHAVSDAIIAAAIATEMTFLNFFIVIPSTFFIFT
jgi:hypothetical protein